MGATKKNVHLFFKLKMVQKVILEVIRTTQRPFSIFKKNVHIFFVAANGD